MDPLQKARRALYRITKIIVGGAYNWKGKEFILKGDTLFRKAFRKHKNFRSEEAINQMDHCRQVCMAPYQDSSMLKLSEE